MSTLRFRKHRASDSRHIYLVTFDGTHPAFDLTRAPWRIHSRHSRSVPQAGPSHPWVNLGGGGRPDQFYAGGWIEQAGPHVAQIELQFANGLVLHDDSAKHAALFITDQTVMMAGIVVLVDLEDNEISRHPAFREH
jgi:hypothetical protein